MALSILYFSYQYYRARGGKTPIAIGVLFSASLGLVSVYPDVFNGVFNLLTQSRHQYYRIIILLIGAVFILFLLQLRSLFFNDAQERTIKQIVKSHAVQEFRNTYDPSEVKPVQVVVPAYNEAENLRELLEGFPSSVAGNPVGVLVVSDGSEDDTKSVVERLGYPVVSNLGNLGGGLALQSGFEVSRRFGAEVIVTMDADGQHDPADLAGLLKPILSDEYDLVVGSRRKGESEGGSLLRRAGITFFNGLISLLLSQNITDCSNGYRAFSVDLLDRLRLSEPQYHTTEFLIQALNSGARYTEVPVTIHQREHGESKKGPDLLYGFHFFRVLFSNWWKV